MLAVGSEELGERIEEVDCPHCSEIHQIQYGTTKTLQEDGTWSEPKKDNLLGFYKCGKKKKKKKKTYLASIKGRRLK